jgi:hypothetical protein
MESVNFLSARYVVPVQAFFTIRRPGFPLPSRCSRGLGGRDALIAKILIIGNFYEGVGVVVKGVVDLKPVVQNETDDVISGRILVKNSTNL